MNTAVKPDAGPAGAHGLRDQRLLLLVAVVLLVPSIYFIWRHFNAPGIYYETGTKRPLLKSEGVDFHDADVGIRFTPPPKWSMQARSFDSPANHRADRLLVKFKRVLPNLSAAWLRVEVVDTPEGQDIAESVKKREPGRDWKSKGDVETMKVGGLPAAKIQHGGVYNGIPSLRDIVGVRRGGQVIYFICTYGVGDRQAQEQTRQAIQTALFDDR